jgi:hypothetical protein
MPQHIAADYGEAKMTMLQITETTEAGKFFGFVEGAVFFSDSETACFYTGTSPSGHAVKFSKKTGKLVTRSGIAPSFTVIEFTPAEDPNAWIKADAELIAKRQAKK